MVLSHSLDDGSLEDALARATVDSRGLELLAELGDLTLDQFLDDGLLKDAPIVGGVFRLLKTGSAIREWLFAKKVAQFLAVLRDVQPEHKNSFRERVEADQAFGKRVGTALLMILDKLTDLESAALLAHLFASYLADNIDLVTFRRLAAALDFCIPGDLTALPIMRGGAASSPTMHSLARAGLVEIKAIPSIRGRGAEVTYQVTWLGKAMIDALGTVIAGERT